MVIQNISSYKHYKKVFKSKNKLYKHLRNYEYSKLLKSSDTNIAIKKKRIAYYTLISTTLIAEISILTIISILPLSIYRAISLLSPIYKIIILKIYLTIVNLYIRYALLKYFKSLYFILTRFITTRQTIRYSIIFFYYNN